MARLANCRSAGKSADCSSRLLRESERAVGAGSGPLLQAWPDELLVVYDELDLPPGTARFKSGGGHGGHNGLRDIFLRLGSRDFNRLRIGIGHPGDKSQVSDYVLTRPRPEQRELMHDAIDQALRVYRNCVWSARAGDRRIAH